MLFKRLFKETKQEEENNRIFTQGEDKTFTYELTNTMAVVKYKFQDDYHAAVKVIPIVMVDGQAYMNEGYPMYDAVYSINRIMGDGREMKASKSRSWLMHDIHRILADVTTSFTGNKQECNRIYHRPEDTDDWLATIVDLGNSIKMTIRGDYKDRTFKKDELEMYGFHKLDMTHA